MWPGQQPAKEIAEVAFMPADTDQTIRQLCARLCKAGDDSEGRAIVGKLRAAIAEHLRRAKSSLGTQASVIRMMDPENPEAQ